MINGSNWAAASAVVRTSAGSSLVIKEAVPRVLCGLQQQRDRPICCRHIRLGHGWAPPQLRRSQMAKSNAAICSVEQTSRGSILARNGSQLARSNGVFASITSGAWAGAVRNCVMYPFAEWLLCDPNGLGSLRFSMGHDPKRSTPGRYDITDTIPELLTRSAGTTGFLIPSITP